MTWTDETLATCQRKASDSANRLRQQSGRDDTAERLDTSVDLYRLARLGLAAETMGRGVLDRVTEGSAEYSGNASNFDWQQFAVFWDHPAWRK